MDRSVGYTGWTPASAGPQITNSAGYQRLAGYSAGPSGLNPGGSGRQTRSSRSSTRDAAPSRFADDSPPRSMPGRRPPPNSPQDPSPSNGDPGSTYLSATHLPADLGAQLVLEASKLDAEVESYRKRGKARFGLKTLLARMNDKPDTRDADLADFHERKNHILDMMGHIRHQRHHYSAVLDYMKNIDRENIERDPVAAATYRELELSRDASPVDAAAAALPEAGDDVQLLFQGPLNRAWSRTKGMWPIWEEVAGQTIPPSYEIEVAALTGLCKGWSDFYPVIGDSESDVQGSIMTETSAGSLGQEAVPALSL